MVTWGTSPEQAAFITDRVPDPREFEDADKQAETRAALDYMGLEPGTRLDDIPVDHVFIGSCTNGRIEDLRAAAEVARHGKAPGHSLGWYPARVPCNGEQKKKVCIASSWKPGFEWRDPGCSLCTAINGDELSEGVRCASTSNRNFRGRQGRGSRTHLVSPADGRRSRHYRPAHRRPQRRRRNLSMQAFTTLTAIAAPVDEPNLDTNQLCPTRFNKLARNDPEYARVLFNNQRFQRRRLDESRVHPQPATVRSREDSRRGSQLGLRLVA